MSENGRHNGSVTPTGSSMDSYYGRPVIKEPVWQPEIPVYFFTGGLGGASAVLSLAATVAGNEKLAKTARYVGAAAATLVGLGVASFLGRRR